MHLKQIVQETLKIGIGILVSNQVVLKLRIKTVKMLFGSITQELLDLPKFWWYFWVPWTISYMLMLIIVNYSTKHPNLGLGVRVQYPLNDLNLLYWVLSYFIFLHSKIKCNFIQYRKPEIKKKSKWYIHHENKSALYCILFVCILSVKGVTTSLSQKPEIVF